MITLWYGCDKCKYDILFEVIYVILKLPVKRKVSIYGRNKD